MPYHLWKEFVSDL